MARKAKTTSGNATPTIDGSKKYIGCITVGGLRHPMYVIVTLGEPFSTTPLSRKGRKNKR